MLVSRGELGTADPKVFDFFTSSKFHEVRKIQKFETLAQSKANSQINLGALSTTSEFRNHFQNPSLYIVHTVALLHLSHFLKLFAPVPGHFDSYSTVPVKSCGNLGDILQGSCYGDFKTKITADLKHPPPLPGNY